MFYVNKYKVVFKHDRADLIREVNLAKASRLAGSTLCMVFDMDTKEMVNFGWHICQKRGCFNKNIQRKEAMKHAIHNFDRDIRAQFWHEYFAKRNGKVV